MGLNWTFGYNVVNDPTNQVAGKIAVAPPPAAAGAAG